MEKRCENKIGKSSIKRRTKVYAHFIANEKNKKSVYSRNCAQTEDRVYRRRHFYSSFSNDVGKTLTNIESMLRRDTGINETDRFFFFSDDSFLFDSHSSGEDWGGMVSSYTLLPVATHFQQSTHWRLFECECVSVGKRD